MSKKIFFCAGIVLLAMFFGGCASTAPKGTRMTMGTPIDRTKVDSIVKNETTAEEILEMFGQPASKALAGDQEQWMWMYNDIISAGTATGTQAVMLHQRLDVFIKDGIVVNYLFN